MWIAYARVAEGDEFVVCVDLVSFWFDQAADGGWSRLCPHSFSLCIEASVQEVIVREELRLQLGQSDYVLMCDESLSATAFHAASFLGFADRLLVLNDAHDILDDWLVSGRVLLSDLLLRSSLLLSCLPDRLDVSHS